MMNPSEPGLRGLFDTHCHLAAKEFDQDRDKVLQETLSAGISHAMIIATGLEDGRRALALSQNRSVPELRLFATLGLHPHESRAFSDDFARDLKSEIASYQAVGETGLDYHYDFSPRDIQMKCFDYHTELAIEISKPLVIHCRESVEDIHSHLLSKKGRWGKAPGIMHCFAESWDWAKKFLDLGFYLSFSGIITFKNAAALREVVRQAPLDRILIETDAPYLAPVPYRGKRNLPAYLPRTFEELCRNRCEQPSQIKDQLMRNSCQVFSVN